MATNSTWTVVMDDKKIINQTVKNENGAGTAYKILDDDAFWNQSKYADVWAIQYVADNLDHNDTVEYRDGKPHATWNNANLGDFSDFITKWDATHLSQLQADWDADVIVTTNDDGSETTESEEDQIARKGARPTSYSSL